MPERQLQLEYGIQWNNPENFANWSIGKNLEYLNRYFDFCDIQPTDNLLDVACGPGEFTIIIAKRILEARGVDISD